MKTVVIPNDISIPGVVNDAIYQHYTSLLKEDILKLFKSPRAPRESACPGCGTTTAKDLALVMGLMYKSCPSCGSYFVSPRPCQETLNEFYRQSSACAYWRQEMTALPDQKLYYIYGPRVAWMIEWADEELGNAPLLLDYQTKYSFLIKHISAQKVFGSVKLLSDQLFEKRELLSPDFYVKDNGELSGHVDMFTSFEGLERVSDPAGLVRLAYEYCRSGGLFLFTTATSSGFEYQVLKQHAPNLNPINRLNLLSLEAIVGLVEKQGFEILEFSTPGRLDVDIVKSVLEKEDLPDVDPFWKYVFGHRPVKTFQALQQFLQESRLSSHVRIVAKKK